MVQVSDVCECMHMESPGFRTTHTYVYPHAIIVYMVGPH